jgi:hypothetical protein
MKTTASCILKESFLLLATVSLVSAQKAGDVIINEIGFGNSVEGDYVELLVVKPGGVAMAGWFLTDLKSADDTPTGDEGVIKFSDEEGSIFHETIPQGTYILVCLGSKDLKYGGARQEEDVQISDGNNRIVVFADGISPHALPTHGVIQLRDSDNVALVSRWANYGGIDIVAWDERCSWKGDKITEIQLLPDKAPTLAYFVPSERTLEAIGANEDAANWVITQNLKYATPGFCNPSVDDSLLYR